MMAAEQMEIEELDTEEMLVEWARARSRVRHLEATIGDQKEYLKQLKVDLARIEAHLATRAERAVEA